MNEKPANCHLKPVPCRKGFTLIELLVTISIIAILFGVGMAQYMRFNRRQIVLQAAQKLKSGLRLAQDKALSGQNPKSWCNGDGETLRGHRLSCSGSSFSIEAVCSSNLNPRPVKTESLSSEVTCSGSALFEVLGRGAEATSFTISGYGGEFSETITITATGEIKREE